MAIDRKYIVNLKGKEFVTYEGLLNVAHERGLKSIDTELLQVPTPDNGNVAICKATVTLSELRVSENVGMEEHAPSYFPTFSGIGDASPDNVSRGIAPHIIRQSETRAKARALRDALGVGTAAFEEMGEEDAPRPARASVAAPGGNVAPIERARPDEKAMKSQVDLLKTLAEELRGEGGVERLEARIGKPLAELGRAEADDWIDRLTPGEARGG